MSHNTRRSSNLRAGDPARKLIPSRKNQRYITSPPTLPRFRQSPRKPGDVGADSHEFTTPQAYYRRQYFEALDLLINELKRRFQQKRGLPVAAEIEKKLLSAANGTFKQICDDLQLYQGDLDFTRLQIQLQMLPDLIETRNKKLSPGKVPINKVMNVCTLCDVLNQDVPMSGEMFSEVKRLLKIFYTIPVTTATAERSFSALRRLKTSLRYLQCPRRDLPTPCYCMFTKAELT